MIYKINYNFYFLYYLKVVLKKNNEFYFFFEILINELTKEFSCPELFKKDGKKKNIFFFIYMLWLICTILQLVLNHHQY